VPPTLWPQRPRRRMQSSIACSETSATVRGISPGHRVPELPVLIEKGFLVQNDG
jgi:hypothetical protein